MNVKSFFLKHRSTFTTIVLLLAFRWSFADQYRVPSESMYPDIQIGDHILTNKMAYDFKIPFTELQIARTNEPARGDIVVFKYPQDESITYVKRVIGLPGETLEIKENKIWINGNPLSEIFLQNADRITYDKEIKIEIPADMYFMMGDNRMNSCDSRYWGLVPRKNLKGKATNVLWNISFQDLIPNINLKRIGKKI